MKKTVIFTQRVEIKEKYGERWDCADQKLAGFIRTCGYIPVPIPNDKNIVRELVPAVNPVGIILSGGNSLCKYGGNSPERDETDGELLRIAIDEDIPVYGFCRGMQFIIDYFGNPIVKVENHVAVRHDIRGEETAMVVNSFHTLGCVEKKLIDLEIVMKADDGVVEKIRHNSLPIIGTMWHPEREDPFRNTDIEMVKKLFGE